MPYSKQYSKLSWLFLLRVGVVGIQGLDFLLPLFVCFVCSGKNGGNNLGEGVMEVIGMNHMKE